MDQVPNHYNDFKGKCILTTTDKAHFKPADRAGIYSLKLHDFPKIITEIFILGLIEQILKLFDE